MNIVRQDLLHRKQFWKILSKGGFQLIQFNLLSICTVISNWRLSKIPKIPVQIDRRSGSLGGTIVFVKKFSLWPNCAQENELGSTLEPNDDFTSF